MIYDLMLSKSSGLYSMLPFLHKPTGQAPFPNPPAVPQLSLHLLFFLLFSDLFHTFPPYVFFIPQVQHLLSLPRCARAVTADTLFSCQQHVPLVSTPTRRTGHDNPCHPFRFPVTASQQHLRPNPIVSHRSGATLSSQVREGSLNHAG